MNASPTLPAPPPAPAPLTLDDVCPSCGNGDEGNWYPVTRVCVVCRTNETRQRVAREMQAGCAGGVAASLALMCIQSTSEPCI